MKSPGIPFVLCLSCVVLWHHIIFGEYSEYVTRQTLFGTIRGSVTNRLVGEHVEQYLGVPFAAPPKHSLRFERPQKPRPWKGVLDTLELPPACPQMHDFQYVHQHYPDFWNEDEDCLYLNIFVPLNTSTTNPLPVLLYIHGGSNEVGMGGMFDGDILAGFGDIIVINFNYRLGAFGFFGAKEEGLEGNYGFLDQVAAMRWVNENVHYFGGDPNRVTIDGHSAGAADVGFHLISPLTKGLFQYAVIQSGSPLAFWAMAKSSWKQGYNVNLTCQDYWCPSGSNSVDYKQFLKELSITQIRYIPGRTTASNLITFPAVVDGYYLKERPEMTFQTGKFHGEAYLMSFTRDEGSEHAQVLLDQYDKSEEFSQEMFKKVLQLYKSAFPNVCGLTELILHEYSNWENLRRDNESLLNFIEMESDLVFVAPMINMANMMAKWTRRLFLFRFEHTSHLAPGPKWKGVPHGRDLFYIFGAPLVGHPLYTYSETDKEASRTVMTLWSNFVKHGFLTLDGETPYLIYNTSTRSINRLLLDEKELNIQAHPNFKPRKMAFWNSFLPLLDKSGCICSGSGISICANTVLLALSVLVVVCCTGRASHS
ncbi:pyrethroid hydrolase Ces2e-like [Argopecten irradians]|uniref:pyrethroid hydrolase Ces2e-like n=1 Tax=Argopecten irradians TaxID=31199 RepID=UPI003718294F